MKTTISQNELLVIGGAGLLGTELKKYFPQAHFTDKELIDVTKPETIDTFLDNNTIKTVVHMAALMPPKKSDEDPAASVQVNIIGVANVAVACMKRNIRMIYISTDYVFRGDEGDYKEEDSLYAPNKYAWSKLGGECVMRMYGNGVIVRLSFGPMKFPYPKAFSDQYTSKESVGVVAQKIAKIIESDFLGVIHIGGKRRSVFEYAKSLEGSEAVEAMSRLDVRDYIVPKDTSLNSTKYDQLFNSEKEYGLI